MQKRQFQNMLRRRKEKQDARAAQQFVTAPSVRPPTQSELDELDRLLTAERDAHMLEAKIKDARKQLERMDYKHLLWRASRLCDMTEGGQYRPNHPTNAHGRPMRMRSLLGLPNDPKRSTIETTVPVVSRHVWDRYGKKGRKTGWVQKPLGFREVDSAEEFLLHSTLNDPVAPVDLLRWMEKLISVIESGDLLVRIQNMENIYGRPQQIVMPTTPPPPTDSAPRSRPTTKVPSKVRAYGKRASRAKLPIHIPSLRVSRGPFHQNRRMIVQAFFLDTYSE